MAETATSGVQWRPSPEHWGVISKTLHWVMGLMIITMLVVGIIMTNLPNGQLKFDLYQMHKSFGFTVMALAFIRLVWRVTAQCPPLPVSIAGWQRVASHVSHVGLYLAMFLMPLTGWLMVSASTLGIKTEYFGLFTIPHIVSPDEDFAKLMSEVHEYIAFALIGLLVIHAGAAIKHHLIDKDTVLSRMLPGRPRR